MKLPQLAILELCLLPDLESQSLHALDSHPALREVSIQTCECSADALQSILKSGVIKHLRIAKQLHNATVSPFCRKFKPDCPVASNC